MTPSRRHFLATAGALALGACVSPRADGMRSSGRVGVQLYTLREAMQRDVAATLARVAATGYTDVEFAGYFDHSPERIAALLSDNGLAAPSCHVSFDEVRDDPARVFDVARRAGHEYVTVAWIDADERRSVDDARRIAALLNERGARARDAGLRLAFHNHDYAHQPLDGATLLDLLLAETDPAALAFQLDVYWAATMGIDVTRLLESYPGRFAMTHLKDSAGAPDHRMVDVGSGTLDFPGILAAAQAAGVQHHFVEHDEPQDPFGSVAASFAYIAGLQQK